MIGKNWKKLLTKSNYLLGLQCHKLVHVKLYDKERIPSPDDSTMYRFETGNIIEAMAKTLFPNGIDVPRDDFVRNLELTEELLKKRLSLFEPSFKFGQTYSRGDVLVPVGENEWDIVEIKSATKVKDINLHDVSFQKYVYENCGLKIRKCFLMYINKEYVKHGAIEADKLFVKTDITKEVEDLSVGIEERIQKILDVINNEIEPSYEIGSHCSDPYNCPIKKECWAELPNGNILEFYKKEKIQCFDLGGGKLIKIPKVPDFYSEGKNPIQKKMTAIRMGENFEKHVFQNFFQNLTYPIYYLDIQTINPAIPRYDGMKPYKKIPYQISIQIQEYKDSDLTSVSFLAEKDEDPRIKFLNILKDTLGDVGTILVYDSTKEQSILKGLAWTFPDFKNFVGNITSRIKDIWGVLENFHYFDIDGNLKSHIKYQIPKLSNINHESLNVRTGEDRGLDFEKIIFTDEEIEISEINETRDKLEKEGLRDSRDMSKILEVFYDISKN